MSEIEPQNHKKHAPHHKEQHQMFDTHRTTNSDPSSGRLPTAGEKSSPAERGADDLYSSTGATNRRQWWERRFLNRMVLGDLYMVAWVFMVGLSVVS
jgi:hypothetical protein